MPEFLVFRFTDQRSPLLRDPRGLYVNAQAQLAQANRTAAHELQALVVRTIANNILRPQVSTDRLIHVTASAGNTKAVPGGWQYGYGVGIPDYLDASISKYWRTIEEGSEVTWKRSKFTDLKLKGVWGASLSGLGSGKWGSRAFGGPKWTKAGKATGGKFVPANFKGLKAVHPHHEIQGQFAYATAWKSYDGGGRVRKDLHALLASISGKAAYSGSGSSGAYAFSGNFHGFGG